MATNVRYLRDGKGVMPAHNLVCVRVLTHRKQRVLFLCMSMSQRVLWVSVLVCVCIYSRF